MGAMAIGLVLGFIAGSGSGTVAGSFAGGMLGMLVGLSVHGLGWARAHSGNAPTVEHHRLMCLPTGSYADCELVGDKQRGRWLDVTQCSLQDPRAGVTCSKTCLRLLNDSRVKPGRGCGCE
ncbi:MAG TPA: hypothetical protein VL172_15915 [Kofleriaceae bacterium]|jgi:hypothetical protein|nr:hypothetical protein [Kofleriaceae bacterium]